MRKAIHELFHFIADLRHMANYDTEDAAKQREMLDASDALWLCAHQIQETHEKYASR